MEILRKLVKNNNSNNQWFSSSSGVFYGKTEDTSDKAITCISDGTYCATFTVVRDGNTYYLVDYSFETDTTKGYSFIVE